MKLLKKWKCIVGGTLLALPFVGIFVFSVITEGLKTTLLSFGVGIILVVVISFGVVLVGECLDERGIL